VLEIWSDDSDIQSSERNQGNPAILQELMMKYSDRLMKMAVKFNISFSLNILLVLIVLHGQYRISLVSDRYIELDKKLDEALTKQRVLLTPAATGTDVFERGSIVSDSYIKGAAEEIVKNLESWTYESIKDNYSLLYKFYYDHLLQTKTEADLKSTDRFRVVNDKKMVSIWKPKKVDGEYTWCEAIDRACAIVSGTTSTYIGHNQPYKSEEKTYFILARDIFPNKKNPFALKVTRLVVGKRSEMLQLMEAAKNGSLKDV